MQQSEHRAEIDFRDLIRKPEKLFGYSYLYFTAAIVLVGMFYIWHISDIGKNSVRPVAPPDSSVFIRDIPLQSPVVLPPVDVMKAGIATDSMVARGREIFRANCTSCHGESGMGDGPSAASLNPKPRNFHSLQGWTNGSKVSQIFKTLQEGIVKNGMASYNYMPPADRFALIHFVRTFATGQPADSADDLKQLELTYQLSKGSNTPGQIPVAKAKQLVVTDADPEVREVASLVAMVKSDTVKAGAQILREVAADLKKAVTALVGRRGGFHGVDDLVRVVSADPGLTGFKEEVSRLSDDEWGELYSYIGVLLGSQRS